MNLNELLRSLRIDAGMTQRELADKLGKSQAQINMWENGKFKPNLDSLMLYSVEFNISLDEIIKNK